MEKIISMCLESNVMMRDGNKLLFPDNIIVYDGLTMNKISRNR